MNRLLPPLLAFSLMALPAAAEEIYFDGTLADGGLHLGATELFEFGPFGAGGEWAYTNRTVAANQVCVLVATDGAGNGGHGASVHLPYPDALAKHGPLAPGNVLRLSGWLAVDPAQPVNRQDWQFAILKFEFYKTALGDPDDTDAVLYDSDRSSEEHRVTTSYTNALSATEWRQFTCEYAYDASDFAVADLVEVRPVVVQGDFTGEGFEGNVLLDNLRVEIFADAAAAKASPPDATPPAPLKESSK